GPGPASRVAAVQPCPSALGLSTRPRPAPDPKLAREPQGHPAALARGRLAGAGPAPQTPADRHLHLSIRTAGRRASQPRVGAGLPVRPDPRREETQDASRRTP